MNEKKRGRDHAVGHSFVLLATALFLLGCRREERRFRPDVPFADRVLYSERYEKNAYNLSEGKRLYIAFNCVGCHGHGGGGMGPPLMDEQWLYGHEPEQIHESIASGRPNGMPSFGRRVPAYQIWQMVAYVRSLSGWAPLDAAPGRDDDMTGPPPEHSRKEVTPMPDPDPEFGRQPK